MHAPLEHTRPLPQAVPSGAFPETVQTSVPVAHDVCPTLQGAVTVHAVPLVQLTHPPSLQTLSVPQAVPSDTLVPRSVQVGAAPEHESEPSWQPFAGTQLEPEVHVWHTPASHTWPAPQLVPSGASPVSTQLLTPAVHAVFPVRHGLLVVQSWSATHEGRHEPAWQTLPLRHAVPSATAVPVSKHDS